MKKQIFLAFWIRRMQSFFLVTKPNHISIKSSASGRAEAKVEMCEQ